ncbi:MAG TPA: NAD(P)H-binding protein [Thermoleophilaceae bacterium]|jgi:uncharacterized protein YbjT (DUF2867 family)
MQSRRKFAVTGATGRLGPHVVDALRREGHDVVPISRSNGVDVVTGEGLDEALVGVEAIVDAATPPTPDQQAAVEFFTAAAHNLQEAGERAGIGRIVIVSIIGIDRYTSGYQAGKIAQERSIQAGPVPARVARAAQFHEFVDQLLEWTTQDGVAYLPRMRTQLVAAKAVGEELAALIADPAAATGPIIEIAGPREENLAEAARRLVTRRGDRLRIEEVYDPDDPLAVLYANGANLPGPGAKLVGPTFDEWLGSEVSAAA